VDTLGNSGSVYRVAAVRDALGTDVRSAAVVVRQGRVQAVGYEGGMALDRDLAIVAMPETLLLPVFANAHAHLDLTDHGPHPCGGDFVQWLANVAGNLRTDQTEQSIQRGLAMSCGAGVGYLGDIVHSSRSIAVRQQEGNLPGVSYLECFGIGARQDEACEQLADQMASFNTISESFGPESLLGHVSPQKGGCSIPSGGFENDPSASSDDQDDALSRLNSSNGLAVGISPHAPYSAGLRLYLEAAKLANEHGYRVTTHLAESLEEVQFVRDATGPLTGLLRDLGKWDDSIKPTGLHPVEWLEPVLNQCGWLLAHCNYLEDHHIEILATCKASVVYCPIASDYFGHHRPDRASVHRYRDLLIAGVNVCLGTDSILCQRPQDAQPLGIGTQMRYLFRRDGTDPSTILAMGTINGMRAMGLSTLATSVRPGAVARWVGVRIDPDNPMPPLNQALLNDEPMQLIDASNV